MTGAGPTQQRADARAQLLDGERLDEVVVGACVEPLDPVVDRVPRSDDQNGDGIASVAERAADVEAADLGHQEIEDDRVGRRGAVLCQRVGAVDSLADLVVDAERTAIAERTAGSSSTTRTRVVMAALCRSCLRVG